MSMLRKLIQFCRTLRWAAPLSVLLALSAMAHSAQVADPNKTVRFAFIIAETGFDPARESDRYSNFIIEAIFDPLLAYDYLARPVKLRPNAIEAMPEISDNGATYVFHLRKGIYFTDHPAFKGKSRELTAQDYAYSIRRFYDPLLRSPNLRFFQGKIIGADAVMEQAKKAGKYDYDAPIAGLEVLDRYTLRIRLREPDYNFLYFMAMPNVAGVAREVAEFYGLDEFRAHPVGTGPFVLKEWRRSSRIVLEANPGYREEYFEGAAEDTAEDRAIVANLKGRKLPLVNRVEVTVIEEPQPRWISFVNKEFDYIEKVPEEFLNIVSPGGKLAPNLAKQGIKAQLEAQMEITITAMYNMEDPVIGGYGAEKVALRRAMNLAFNGPEEDFIARKGQVVRAQSAIPPGAAGYDPNFRSAAGEYNLAKAKALLDMYGYADNNGDGYREMPDGQPLLLEIASPPDAFYRQMDEIWQKSMDALGVHVKFRKEKWPDLNTAGQLGTLQIGAFYAWAADYPDADDFFQLLYGPNSRQSNYSNFKLAAFDRLYEQAKKLPDSPERDSIYRELNKLILAYAPWKLGVHRIWTNLAQPWLLNYKKHPIMRQGWKYLDIDVEAQRKAVQ